jgi:hypothetical protein
MNYRVDPTEPNPTHHILLRDRNGRQVGLILCDERGNELSPPAFNRIPVETTALKQTSGASSYADFDYPYSPIVQDTLDGGRGNLDFERDSTKFYDSYRCKSGVANKAYAGPQEQYVTGPRTQDQNIPGNVTWQSLHETTHVYTRFQAGASYTTGLVWILARIKGEPNDLQISIYADNAGAVQAPALASITVDYTRMADTLSEWLCETFAEALTAGSYYWLAVSGSASDTADNHWLIAVKPATGTTYASVGFDTTPPAAAFDLYYRLTDANTERTCIFFEYKRGWYAVVSPPSGAPSLYLIGYRGAADSNAGQLTKLIDGAASWTADEFAGSPVMITDGTGRLEAIPHRTASGNTGTEITLSEAWTITHDTTTEYVVFATKPREITGHGLTAPITDVLVSITGVIYFCMGDSTTVRRMREYNNAGTWTREYADETATTKAVFMVYKEQSKKLCIANNADASGNVSVALSSNVSGSDPIIPEWGTALTWATAVQIGSRYYRITGLSYYPDPTGVEAVWVFKEDIPYIFPNSGNPYPITLEEMRAVAGQTNGVRPMKNGIYLYFPMQQGIERYYNGQIDDMGPNLGEGLPANRRGPVVWMQTFPGKFFAAIDAGSAGYSSIVDSDGWHERYRAPLGQRIRTIAHQVTPGSALNRLWIYQGSDFIWLPMPSDTVNELNDSTYLYTHEFAVTLSRMHAGMFDVMKMIRKLKLQSENLAEGTCWFELDYRTNEEDTWTAFEDPITLSPTQERDFIAQYGLAGKRLQFRLRGYTSDATQTPIFLAIIINAVLRNDVKYMYPITFRVMDQEPMLGGREEETTTAEEKKQIAEDFSDASSDSMLLMSSTSFLFHGRMVFMNPFEQRHVRMKNEEGNPFKRDVIVCAGSLQEA